MLLPLAWLEPATLDTQISLILDAAATGYIDSEEAITRLVEIGHTRTAAEGRVDSRLRRGAA